jgi:hypothetical protein
MIFLMSSAVGFSFSRFSTSFERATGNKARRLLVAVKNHSIFHFSCCSLDFATMTAHKTHFIISPPTKVLLM